MCQERLSKATAYSTEHGRLASMSADTVHFASAEYSQLTLNKSSLVIPGFLGTPAGIMTRSAPFKASAMPS